MYRDKYRLIYRRYRRIFEKRFGGYISEVILYSNYLFQRKREPSIKFVIFGYQRTGSTLLVNLLDSHPQIECEGELLLNRMAFPKHYLKYRARLSSNDIFGFKLLTPHFDYQKFDNPDQFMIDLNDSGYKIIKLKRNNIFRTALSLLYAINSGRFHFQQSSVNKEVQKINVDPSDLLEKLQWIEFTSLLTERVSKNIPLMEIVYEDDLLNPAYHQVTVDRISDYLGIPHAVVHTKLVKYTDDISQLISNVEEINSFIRNTKYAKYLEI